MKGVGCLVVGKIFRIDVLIVDRMFLGCRISGGVCCQSRISIDDLWKGGGNGFWVESVINIFWKLLWCWGRYSSEECCRFFVRYLFDMKSLMNGGLLWLIFDVDAFGEE